MEITFQFPNKAIGADGVRRIVSETEMEALIEADGEDWYVASIYAWEHRHGGERFELREASPEFREARNYLYTNPQERSRIDEAWEKHTVESRPSRGLRVHEHSTYFGRP